jgi:hypothetical protein
MYRQDIALCPLRLSQSIPATATVMEHFYLAAKAQQHRSPQVKAEVIACAMTTYYMALRAGEGVAMSNSKRKSNTADDDELSPDQHNLQAKLCSFRFPNDHNFYPAHRGTVFPAGKVPISFDVLQDTSKTSLQRGSSHISAHRNPNLPGAVTFDVVLSLWDYVSNYPPPKEGDFFPSITIADIAKTMKITANHPDVRLDDSRLTPRCMRSGSATMLRNLKNNIIEQQDLEMIRDQGRWACDTGSRIYSHQSADASRLLVQPSLYDSGFMTLHYLRWFYMSAQ